MKGGYSQQNRGGPQILFVLNQEMTVGEREIEVTATEFHIAIGRKKTKLKPRLEERCRQAQQIGCARGLPKN